MTRWRLDKRLRTSPEIKGMAHWLDERGIKWQIVKRNNQGHPEIEVTGPQGQVAYQIVSSTCKGSIDVQARIARLKRKLRTAGIDC